MNFGSFEGKTYFDLNGNEDYQRWIDSGGTLPFPGGESREQLWNLVRKLNREKNVTIILVSHDMEDVYEMSERILLMDCGKIMYDGGTGEFFEDRSLLEQYGIDVPDGAKM